MNKKTQKITLSDKAHQLNRTIRFSDLKEHVEALVEKHPAIVHHIYDLANKCSGTPMEGLPFTIATMRAQLYSYEEIASALGLKIKDVKNISKTDGFDQAIHLMRPMIYSDLTIAAQACIMHHLTETKDVRLAQWVLESVGEVGNTQPVTINQHKHQTLNLLGGQMPQMNQNLPQLPDSQGIMPVEQLAEALFNRFKTPSTTEPAFRLNQ